MTAQIISFLICLAFARICGSDKKKEECGVVSGAGESCSLRAANEERT